jgi:hypothetical protein
MALFQKNWKGRGQIATENTIKAMSPVTGNSVRIISPAAFKQRFTVAERDAARTSTDNYVKDIWDDLNSRLYIDLDIGLVAAGIGHVLNALTTVPNFQDVNAMTVTDPSLRTTEILVDGLTTETYNGIL